MNTTIARYAEGITALALIAGALAIVAVAVRRRYLDGLEGAPARLAEVVIGWAALIAVLELLGTVGLFRLVPVTLGCLAAAVVAGWRVTAPRPGAAPGTEGRDRRRTASLALTGAAVLGGAIVLAEWASPTLQAYDVGVHVVDSLWYHLPWAAALAHSGHITGLRFTDTEFLTAFYPETGELLHGLGIVLLARDTISPAFNLVWGALALLAGYCIGRPSGRGGLTVLGVTLVLASPMMNFSQPGGADNDIVGAFFLLAAVALLVSASGRRGPYVLAAVATGIAASMKLTLVLPVAALTVGVLAIATRGERRSAAVWWLVPELLAGGYWYLRDLIAIGNPFPWVGFGVLPTPAPAQQQSTGYTIAHYLTDGRFWSHFAEPAFASGLGRWWVVIVVLAIAGPLSCVALGPTRLVRMLGIVALATLAAYALTPESAGGPLGDPVGTALNVRYSAPGLTLALAVLPLSPLCDGIRRQLALAAGLLATLAATVIEPALWPARHAAGAIALGIVALTGGTAALAIRAGVVRASSWGRVDARGRAGAQRRASVRRRMGARRRVGVALAGALVVLLAAGGAGYAWQRHYLRGRYAYRPHVSQLAHVWALFRGIHDARVGLVGSYGVYFAYPLFGLDDSNTVIYLAHHGPHGSFTPITGCAEWRTAVNAAHVRYLVTTPKREFWAPKRLLPSPETGWTRGDPAAHVIYSALATGEPIDVFALRGALDPAGCR